MRIARQYEEASHQAKENRLTDTIARRVISDIYQIANKEPLDSSTVEIFSSKWLERKNGEVAEKTSAKYKSVVRSFLESLGSNKNLELTKISKDHLLNFRDKMAERLSGGSVNNAIKVLRVMFSDAVRDALIDRNPAEHISALKYSPHQRRSFTLAEVKRVLLECCTEWRGMVLLGYYTGQRLTDLASLKWRCIDIENDEIRFTSKKTGRLISLPIHPEIMCYFKEIKPPEDDLDMPLFPALYEKIQQNMRSGTLSNQFRKILANAGLVEHRKHVSSGKGRSAKRQQSDLSFHSLRHTATSFLKRAGVSDAIVRDVIGHESTAVSRQYTHMDMKTKRNAMKAMPKIA